MLIIQTKIPKDLNPLIADLNIGEEKNLIGGWT